MADQSKVLDDIESKIADIVQTIRWRASLGPIERIHVTIVHGIGEHTMLFIPPFDDDEEDSEPCPNS